MGRTPSDDVRFDEDEDGEVTAAMAELARAGAGWVNLLPMVEEGYEPPPRSMAAWLFSGRGEPVPMATWTAGTSGGGRATAGIEHGHGANALAHLESSDLPLPPGWEKVTDHARRGLVVSLPGAEDAASVLSWLIDACHLLSPAPLTGEWTATVYRPR